MSELTREQARAIIDDIKETNGGITQADRERTPPGVLRALEHVRQKLGTAVRIIATNLYSTDTRYVFELIQNAEDNEYSCVAAHNEDPFIKFTVCHDRVIVDSNEDGFTERNVRAICSTGESTKTNVQGYIGEKGIGFKSVFKIASKVYIQSGHFSFYFEHRRGDHGLGMVTPIPEEPEDLPEGVRTRMTLILSDPSKFDACVEEIQEIPDTLILFLSKLKNISISIQPLNEDPWEMSYSCAYDTSTSLMVLTKDINNTSLEKIYKVVKKDLSGLPEDLARNGRDRAEVVLAFPVIKHSAELKPVCEEQHVFSFLPMRKVGFKFIVQSDFITQASREDIQRSPWNDAILDGVADTFCDSVIQFCHHPSLRCLWLDYMPQNIPDPFWGRLRDKIIGCIMGAPVFLTLGERLDYALNLRYVSRLYLDQHSQPLFDDVEPELYLSRKYLKSSNPKDLYSMGVQVLSWRDVLRLVGPYLRGTTPKILDQDDDWHTRAAEMFLKSLSCENIASEIKALTLIPLANGALGSTTLGNIFFPTDQSNVLIPADLSLRLVSQSSLTNTKRRELFERLGVQRCSAQTIICRIAGRYNTRYGVSLANSVSHIRYLYRTLPANDSLNPTIFLMDQNQDRVYRRHVTFGPNITVDDLYFEDDNTYGMKKISHAIQFATAPVIHFLHSSYLDAGLPDAPGNERSWKEWLEVVAGVRRVPRLKESLTRNSLSKVFQSIVTRCPDKLLGVLRTYWQCYDVSEQTPQVLEALTNTAVPCVNVQSKPLRSTYLPMGELKDKCADLDITDDMPFVRLPTEWPSDDIHGWRFLAVFGVGMEANLSFFLDALRCVVEKIRESGFTEQQRSRLFKIYEAIYDLCRQEEDANTIRNVFKELEAVYVPSSESYTECFSPPEDCVWSGPNFLRVKSAIGFYDAYRENRKIKDLLRHILKIPNASAGVYLEELARMDHGVNSHHVSVLYGSLLDVARSTQWEAIRSKFESSCLVYLPSQSRWFPPRSCLWTTAPQVGNQFGIASEYADLENLFVDKLLVQAPTIATYIEQLRNISRGGSPNPDEIQSAIRSVDQLHPTANDVDGLRHVKFLPLRLSSGMIVFESPETDFFIVDRVEYGDAFERKVSVLSFSLEEVRHFDRFLLALGLEDRYMSAAVEEHTTVLQPATNPTATLTREFREKAKALFRCAVHFHSSKVHNENEAVFRMLREVQVYESEGFSKTLSVNQSGSAIIAESARGVLHLEEQDNNLKIYVPRDQRDRRRCYANQLPKDLMGHLGINDPAARGIFQNVIRSEMDILDDILEEDGIIQVDLDPSHDDVGDLGADEAASEVVASNLSSGNTDARPMPRPLTPQDHGLETGSERSGSLAPSAVSYGPGRSIPPSPQSTGPIRHPGSSQPLSYSNGDRSQHSTVAGEHEDRTAYTRLLIQVSAAARRANFDMGTLDEAFASRPSGSAALSSSPFGNRRPNQLEHDIRIGAAGELFVFELLSRLDLPNFSRNNWRSNIRKEVRSHFEYRDLEPWNGVETADFVYDDSESAFTRFLSSNGRASSAWNSARPKCYIEVKSTISDFATPFYMSKSQFRRLRASPPFTHPSPDELYIIFRVYNLGSDNVRFWIYVNHYELDFTPVSYSVVPQPLLLN